MRAVGGLGGDERDGVPERPVVAPLKQRILPPLAFPVTIVESMQGDGKAISIALTLAPQDGSADTIVDMNVEPCFVVVTPEDISSLLAFVKSAQKGSSDDFMALGLKVAAKAQ